MTTIEIRKRVNECLELGFTMKEAFECMRDALRTPRRKTSKVAEARAKAVEEGRIEEFDINEYYKNKR
jgi:hypothetical protein